MVRAIHRLILAMTRHWLALISAVMASVLGLALLAPWLMAHGAPGAGQLLYLAYRPLCHQLPERSFFVGGPQRLYSLQELNAHLGYEAPARWIGDGQLGYKLAFCERDTAIYAGWLGAGVAFGLLRWWGRFTNRLYGGLLRWWGRFTNRPYGGLLRWWGRFTNRPYNRPDDGPHNRADDRPSKALPWQAMIAFAAPMLVDGTGQLVGAWESVWWMRVVTGALFAIGTVWFAFPHIDQGMKEAQGVALRSLEEIDATDR